MHFRALRAEERALFLSARRSESATMKSALPGVKRMDIFEEKFVRFLPPNSETTFSSVKLLTFLIGRNHLGLLAALQAAMP